MLKALISSNLKGVFNLFLNKTVIAPEKHS